MKFYDEKQNRWISHRQTAEYRLRKNQLRDYWTIGLLAVIALPVALQLTVIAFAGFLSLCYLDEVPYSSFDT